MTQQSTILLFFLTTLPLFAGQTRFISTVQQYNTHDYLYEKRDLRLSLQKNYADEKSVDDPDIFDTVVFSDNYFNSAVLFSSLHRSGFDNQEKTTSLHTGLDLLYTTREYTILGSGSTYFLDTISNRYRFFCLYDYGRKYFFQKFHTKRSPFLAFDAHADVGISYSKQKDFDPDLDPYDTDFPKDRFITTKEQGIFALNLSPGIGVGRQKNVTPLYQAFKLEREWLKKGVINFPLSEKTLLAIAQLLARYNTYSFKKLDSIKTFKIQLDSIIVLDEAIEREQLRYVSPLEIKKILLSQVPLFMAKPQATLFTTSRLVPQVTRSETVYPYNKPLDGGDTSYFSGSFAYEHLLGLKATWGIALNQWWFLNMTAYRHLLSTWKEIDFLTADHHVRWDEVLDVRWDIRTSIWPVNWMLLNIGIDNVPSWLCVPRFTPLSSYLETRFFIENYCSMNATLAYKGSGKKYASYEKWSPSFSDTRAGFLLTFSITYNF